MNTLTRRMRDRWNLFFIRKNCEISTLKQWCHQGKYALFTPSVCESRVKRTNNFTDKYVLHRAIRLMSTCGKERIKNINITNDGKFCELEGYDDKETSSFHSIWLRHNCHCEQCYDKSSQKTIIPSELSPDVRILSCELRGNNLLHMQLDTNNEVHDALIPLPFLQANAYSTQKLENNYEKRKMLFTNGAFELPKFQYDSVIKSDKDSFLPLKALNEKGLILLKNVPTMDGMVTKIGQLFGPVMHTIYGEYFKVRSEESPINVAYSTKSLGFHMDLMYYESPPGLQLLHCIQYDDCVQGGENRFVDAFQVAENFRVEHPEEFEYLCTIPATFQKIHYDRETPVHMTYQRPHILLSPTKDIIAVNWSPEFEGPLAVHKDKVEQYYQAYFLFAKCLEDSTNIIENKMTEGDAVIFNNRRMLHSRKEFVLNGGIRELHGCYVNIDEYKSRLQYLSNIIDGSRLVHRVGNQDWF